MSRISPKLSINGLVEEAIELGKAELDQCRTKVVLELAENLPAVVGDRIQIEQVILNLVRNGLEAMLETPDGGRLLDIRNVRHGEEAVQVDVSDRGKRTKRRGHEENL